MGTSREGDVTEIDEIERNVQLVPGKECPVHMSINATYIMLGGMGHKWLDHEIVSAVPSALA